jgi:hypothetical protein
MRRIIPKGRLVGVLAAAATVALPLAGAYASPRHDTYYEIWCQTVDGGAYLAKRVDARAIQPDKDPGGKDTATEHYNENNPFGDTCGEVGPISPTGQ